MLSYETMPGKDGRAASALVVDDERAVLDLLERRLPAHGFSVIATDDASEALLLARDARPDVILCDWQLPGLDGPGLCRAIKRGGSRAVPVVLMSGSRVGDEDVLRGFEDGADDYVTKPFSLPVLAARLRAAMRRGAGEADGTLSLCGIELDPAGRTVKAGRRTLPLTRREFDLLAALLSSAGRALSVPRLLESVWGRDPAAGGDPGTVEVHVYQLRRKLGPRLAKRVVNLPGAGYMFDPSAGPA